MRRRQIVVISAVLGLGLPCGASTQSYIPAKRTSPKTAYVPERKSWFYFRDAFAHVGLYVERRILDAVDIFQAQTSWGVGMSADAEILGLLHAGTGASYERAMGFEGRELLRRTVVRAGCPFSNLYHACKWEGSFAVLHERHERSLRFPDEKTVDACYWILPCVFNASPKWERPHWWSRLRVEGGVFVGLIGVRAGLHLGEAADFLVGLFGLDLAGDDLPAPWKQQQSGQSSSKGEK